MPTLILNMPASGGVMGSISFHGVDKVYENGFQAIYGLDLDIADGEFMVLVGPSGCGKTTAMRCCAGLEDISGGEIRIDGQRVDHLQPQDRNISMVFQNYALYPHLTVGQNLEFPLKMKKVPKAERDLKVAEVAGMLELEPLLSRKPKQLSGGQRQRVAMGRALVRHPQAFLMDEPLSNLDAKLRVGMRAEIGALQRRTGTTTLYVTHDQVEAMTMGDRVAIMNHGKLQQVAAPQEIYAKPANLFVATFMGSPSMNIFPGTLENNALTIGEQRLALEQGPWHQSTHQPQFFGLRPEGLSLGEGGLNGQVAVVEPLGHETMVHVDIEAKAVSLNDAGAPVTGGSLRLVARLPGNAGLRAGDTISLCVDTTAIHGFDAKGIALAAA